MALLSKDVLRGFLVPYNITSDMFFDAQATQFTEQEIIADQPIPEEQTKLYLYASGNCGENTDLQIETNRTGNLSKAEFLVRDNQKSASVYYGFDETINIDRVEFVVYASSALVIGVKTPDCLSFEDGSLLVTLEAFGGALSNNQIRAYRRTKDGSLSNVTIASLFGSPSAQEGFPCICTLEDGSILLVHLYEEGGYINASSYRSKDRGSTWSLSSTQILDENIDTSTYTIEKVRVRSLSGQVLLIISANYSSGSPNRNIILQYASTDTGGNFELVTESSKIGDYGFKSPDLIIYKQQFTLVFIKDVDTISYVTIPHAFYQIEDLMTAGKNIDIKTQTGDFAGGASSNMTSGDLSACEYENGSLQVIYTTISDNTVNTAFSSDGLNFTSYATTGDYNSLKRGNVFKIDDASILQEYKLVPYEGRGVLVSSWHADTATNDNSIGMFFLGVYSNVGLPSAYNWTTRDQTNRLSFRDTWFPIERLGDCSIFSTSGSGAEALQTGYSRISVSTLQTDYLVTRTVTGGAQYGLTVKAVIQVDEDDSQNAPFVIQLEIEDPPNLYKFKLVFEEQDIKSYDNTTLINTKTINNTAGAEVLINFYENKVSYWYKTKEDIHLKSFIDGLQDQTITALPTGFTDQTKVIFGVDGSPSGVTAESRVYSMQISDWRANANFINFTENDLIGKRFPIPTKKQYITQGVNIGALNGPTFKGDSWQIQPTSPFSINNSLYHISPSKRVPWRSEAVSSGPLLSMRIPWKITDTDTSLGNDIVGLHLSNINFNDFKIQSYDGSSWSDIATLESSEGMHHGFIKTGNAIKQDPSNVVDRNYYFFNELKDYIAMITIGENTTFHRIISNTEGVFGDSSAKQAIIRLDSEPSGNGNVKIIPKDITVVCSLNGLEARAFAVFIQGQETIDKYYQIGLFCLGEIAITGQQYSKGRRITIEAGSIETITPDRTAYSRNIAPSQRTIEVSWSDGVDISSFYNNNPDPDYFKSSSSGGSLAVSNYKDAPYLLEGVLREIQGTKRPLVYLPKIVTNDDIRVLNRRHEHMIGVLDSEIQMESITGDELTGDGRGEVFRVATITLREVL